MQLARSLPARIDWRRVGLLLAVAIVAVPNALMLGTVIEWAFRYDLASHDWANISNLPANPYEVGAFRWSPPAAWIWSTLVVPLGFGLWSLLHIAAVLSLPRLITAATLLFAPFWMDVASGNILTFAFVAGWHALGGNRWAVVAFVVIAALVPRPIMLPVLAVLLWNVPLARWVFGAATLVVVGWALATGLLDDFVLRLLGTSSVEVSMPWNYGPSRIIGEAWIPIGLVLGAILTWKGRLGLASLAITPYVIHYYLLFGLLELQRNRSRAAD